VTLIGETEEVMSKHLPFVFVLAMLAPTPSLSAAGPPKASPANFVVIVVTAFRPGIPAEYVAAAIENHIHGMPEAFWPSGLSGRRPFRDRRCR
jgi:hypothetical protein